MRHLKLLAVILFLALPAIAHADISNVPDASTWYFHADFDAMRDGKAGRGLYDWLDDEVFAEIRAEIGIDLDKEANQLTAYAASDGPVIVLDGKISQQTKDKILALAAADGELKTYKASGKDYYFFEGDDDRDGGDIDIRIDSLEDEAYVSVALRNKIVITHTREQMEELLAKNGKIRSEKNAKNALFVLRAERSLVQAGVNADEIDVDDDGGWDSNILRNTKKVAVLLADLGDKLGIEAKLLTEEPDMATSMASIIRGLIGLQAFNDEMEPEMAAVLQSTRVDVSGNELKVSLALEPDTVVSALED